MKKQTTKTRCVCPIYNLDGEKLGKCTCGFEQPPTNDWEKRIELAYMRTGVVIDLDQEPPVKYLTVRCRTVQSELDDLSKLHYKLLSQAIDQERERIKKWATKTSRKNKKESGEYLIWMSDLLEFLDNPKGRKG